MEELVFTAGAALTFPEFVSDVEVRALEYAPREALDSYKDFVNHLQYENNDPSLAPKRTNAFSSG